MAAPSPLTVEPPSRSSSPSPSISSNKSNFGGTTYRSSIDNSIRSFLHSHVLFKDLEDDDFINTVAASMQTRIYGDSSYVIRQGEVGRALFFVLRGCIEVVSEDGETVINVMKEQSFFGEIGVLFSVPRTASCRARGRCIVLTLTKGALQKAAALHHEVADKIRLIAEERFATYVKQKDSAMLVEFGQELRLGMTQADLKKVPLFRDCSVGFLHMLALTLTPLQYRQGEIIIRKGDAASEMYFVVQGVAEVFSEEDNTSFAEFPPGSFFGEVGVFLQIKRTGSVRCASNQVAVFKLDRGDLDNLLKQYPEVRAVIQKEAKIRFQYNEEREKSKIGKQMQEETEIEVVREKIKTVPLFKDADVGLLHQLALVMKLKVFSPGTAVIRKDEVGHSMYFVLDGTAEVVSEDGTAVYAELVPNSYFGEVALLFAVNRTATVRSRTQTTMFELSKDALTTVLAQYPSFEQNMKDRAEANLELFQNRQKKVEEISDKAAKRDDLSVEATAARLKLVPLFQNCDDGFLREVALGTSVRQDPSQTLIVRKGAVSREMFFIVHGTVEIVSEDGQTVYDAVQPGGFFGEIGLLRGINRTASVRVGGHSVCSMVVLTADALRNVFQMYPEQYQNIVIEADKRFRVTEARRLESEESKRADDLAASSGSLVESMGEEPEAVKAGEELWDSAAAHIKGSVDSSEASQDAKSNPAPASWKDESQPKPHRTNSLQKLFRRKRGGSISSGNVSTNCSTSSLTSPQGSSTKELPASSKESGGKSGVTMIPVQPMGFKTIAPGLAAKPELKKSSSRVSRMFNNLKFNRKTSSSHKATPSTAIRTDRSSSDSFSQSTASVETTLNSEDSGPAPSISPVRSTTVRYGLQNPAFPGTQGIVAYLNPLDRLKLRLLSKRWNEALRNPVHWETLDFSSIFSVAAPKTFTSLWELSGEHLMTLQLKSCWRIDDIALKALARLCPNVRSLSLSNCWKFTEDGLSFLTQGLLNIREVDLSYCGQINGTSFQRHRWHRLRMLDLTYCKQIGDDSLEALLSRISDLTHLRIRRCIKMTDSGMFSIVRYCRQLQVLDAADCDRFTDRCLKWLATSNKDLHYLDFTFCKRITNAGLYELSLGQQAFTHLDFSYCGHLTDASIVFFTSGVQDLRFLSLRGCRNVTNNVMKHLIRTAPMLRTLDVTGCPLVTVEGKQTLEASLKRCRVLVTVPTRLDPSRVRAQERQYHEVFQSGPADKMRKRPVPVSLMLPAASAAPILAR
ncbi:hypothetical protein HKX48_005868 [Thoreauomyces humboldtii]|nr:hypothetical protein HKX48_005868 [Thoreauomyces humboldtii]